jgi:hypothetical protein
MPCWAGGRECAEVLAGWFVLFSWEENMHNPTTAGHLIHSTHPKTEQVGNIRHKLKS